ncbi:calcium-binding protein [Brasilonema octagenarum UFV-E1]|uniref:Calcium-binding protein n=2 Tax=Brasilonema TaxID=383614 RepID=A0A856MJL7_9CYAN|nr:MULTISPECIES: calcium-binding protein [Brasilonema]NMF63028.1 calcium-binding protein [Brasilonema octagenarum UFV-OR1]QDL10742.1 calcium-binding protein [Brasilonema sennae CENA114]QDL17086.1 calcium-binding protein [Brasilonema octagenarum UFV-E1]
MPAIYGTIYNDNDTYGPDGNFHSSINGTDQADISIFGKEGDDIIYGRGGGDIIDAGSGNDTVYGGDGNDTILGRTGNDVLYGDNGDDVLFGEADNDKLYGGAGNDILWGGDGDDRLDGYATTGTEYDTLKGEAGSDVFVLGGWWGVSYQGYGYATITDFNGAYDWIEVPGNANTQSYNGISYSLGTGNWEGSSATDTLIYYGAQTPENVIAVVQDTTDVNFSRDFRFV